MQWTCSGNSNEARPCRPAEQEAQPGPKRGLTGPGTDLPAELAAGDSTRSDAVWVGFYVISQGEDPGLFGDEYNHLFSLSS